MIHSKSSFPGFTPLNIARINHPDSPVVEFLNSLDQLHHTNQASKFHIIKNNLFARLDSSLSLSKECQRFKNTSKKKSSSYLVFNFQPYSTIYFCQFNKMRIDNGFILFWEEWKMEDKYPLKIIPFRKLEGKRQAKQKPYSFPTNGHLDPGKKARKSRSLNPKPFPMWSMGPSMGLSMGPSMGLFMGLSMNWTWNS